MERQIESQRGAIRTVHTRVQVEPLGEIPNCGLQLPAVSPDGKWIAYLDYQSDKPIELSALFTGRGLEGMSLHVQPVAGGGDGEDDLRIRCGLAKMVRGQQTIGVRVLQGEQRM